MPDLSTLLALATSNPRGFALLALYLGLSGLLSAAIANRSQVDAWAEKHPRFAGGLKLLRGLGLDPWVIIQGLSLIFRGKLPEKLKQAQTEEKRKTINPPPLALLIICVALAYAGIAVACSSQPEPCSPQDAVMIAKAAECKARVAAECSDMLDSECPVIAECDAWGEARCGATQ